MSADACAVATLRCLHCAQPAPAADSHPVLFDGRWHPTCCAGCQAVAQTVIEAGLDDFYRQHRVPGRLPEGLVPQAADPAAHALYDEPEILQRYVRTAGDRAEVELAVEGMHCGACVWLLEQALRTLPGVAEARINFAGERARVSWDPARQSLSAILATVERLGYRAWPFDAARRGEAVRRHGRDLLQRLFVAGLVTMQAMMFALPEYMYEAEGIEPAYRALLRGAGLVLVLPVLLYSAVPFFRGAWRDIRARRPGMDVPVAIGLSVAFLGSARAVVLDHGDVYFDSIAMFTFLLLGARWLEWSARRRAAATLDALSAAAPELARLVDGDAPDGVRQVPVARLVPGDRVVVHTGEPVPADARLLDGRAEFDQSLLTGESAPVAACRGDWVPGGALLASAPVSMTVERAAADSTLSTIARLAERGAAEKPPLARLADRVAAVFVPTILALALVTGLVWAWLEPEAAWPIAIAVLVVSCPCALSLATPTALAAAHAASLRRQLLLANGGALETLATVTDVVFDKTGTLTEGRPTLVATDVLAAGGHSAAGLRALAAALEQGAPHPFADALRRAAASDQLPADPAGAALAMRAHRAGAGVAAVGPGPDGRPTAWFLGSPDWCGIADAARLRATLESSSGAAALSEVWLASMPWPAGADESALAGGAERGARVLARFTFSDPVRAGAAAVLDTLRGRGLALHLLSGDRPDVVAATASALGLATHVGGADPLAKQHYVRALQAAGRRVLMVGDGVNDMPVLASADVSVAFGRPSTLTQSAADVVVLRPRLGAVPELLSIGVRTRRVIRQNLAWAFGYNLMAIPLAAMGWVAPWLAAIGMAASSLVVVANAARLLNAAGAAPAPVETPPATASARPGRLAAP